MLKLTEAERAQLAAAARGGPAHQVPAIGRLARQLPADVAGFAGRTDHLERLDALLAGDGTPTAVVISGTAGVGKTALAVHWAHRVADRFPDGQLYVNLRGFHPGGTPTAPATAVRGFLDALDVPPHRVPADPDAQAALYRSLLADRRMLIVLDNASDAEQVRPLLPGTSGCLAVVTSRHQLTGLAAAEGAHPVVLDLLSTVESRELLARRLGADRVAAEPDAVDDIVATCARRGTTDEPATDRGWIGQIEDDRTGLNYLNARYYDPVISRFLTTGPLYDLARPQTINPYSYSVNSPSSIATLSVPTHVAATPGALFHRYPKMS